MNKVAALDILATIVPRSANVRMMHHVIEKQGCVTALWGGQGQCVTSPAPGTCGELTAHSTVHVGSHPSFAIDSQGNAFVPQDILASE